VQAKYFPALDGSLAVSRSASGTVCRAGGGSGVGCRDPGADLDCGTDDGIDWTGLSRRLLLAVATVTLLARSIAPRSIYVARLTDEEMEARRKSRELPGK